MANDNLPILYRNVMDGLKSDEGRRAFLWATDRNENDRNCYVAEAFAHEVEFLGVAIWSLYSVGFRQHAKRGPIAELSVLMDLYIFTMRRHAHWRFPGNNEAWI